MTKRENSSIGRGEAWLRETTKSSALRRTAGLILEFDLLGVWGLNGSQVEQLKLHMTAAIVRQEGHDDSYHARRPEVQTARKTPVLGRILDFLVFDSDSANQAVEAEFLEEVRQELAELSGSVGDEIAPQIAVRRGFDLGDVQEALSEDWFKGQVADVLELRQIHQVANLIASAYTTHKEDPIALRSNMANILSKFDFHR